MSGCQTCGGFGDRHDPIAHSYDFATEMAVNGEAWVDERGMTYKRGPIVTVRVTDDGTPICPHCGQPTVTDDGGKTWDCPDWAALLPGIHRDLIAAFAKLKEGE